MFSFAFDCLRYNARLHITFRTYPRCFLEQYQSELFARSEIPSIPAIRALYRALGVHRYFFTLGRYAYPLGHLRIEKRSKHNQLITRNMLLVYQDSMAIDVRKPSEPLLDIQTILSRSISPTFLLDYHIGFTTIAWRAAIRQFAQSPLNLTFAT